MINIYNESKFIKKIKREVFMRRKEIRKYSRFDKRRGEYVDYEVAFEGGELVNLINTTDNFAVPRNTRTAKKIQRREKQKEQKDLICFLAVP